MAEIIWSGSLAGSVIGMGIGNGEARTARRGAGYKRDFARSDSKRIRRHPRKSCVGGFFRPFLDHQVLERASTQELG